MEVKRLYKIIDSLPLVKRHFRGIYEKAYIPPHFVGFIIIFIPAQQGVGHYVALQRFGDEIYFFDSYGYSPSHYDISLTCKYNKQKLQGDHSCLCAAYILYCFNVSINKKIPIELVIKTDFKNTQYNDSLIHEWMSKLGVTNLLTC